MKIKATTLTLALITSLVFPHLSVARPTTERIHSTTKTTTTKHRRSSRRVKKRNHSNKRVIANRSYSRRTRSRRGRSSRRAVVHHRSARRSTVHHRGYGSRHIPGNAILEIGYGSFLPVYGDAQAGLNVNFGYRSHTVGLVGELKFDQEDVNSSLSDAKVQLRVYVPVTSKLEVFPTVGFGVAQVGSKLTDEVAGVGHFDLGLGAQFNVTDHLGFGLRYSARVVSQEVRDVPSNGHDLIANFSLRF